jgi:putative endonuclease
MVGRLTLDQVIGVRIPVRQPRKIRSQARSSRGEPRVKILVSPVTSIASFTGPCSNMYWTYILENEEDKSWYIGATADLKRRIIDHQKGVGGQTTSRKKKWKLIYCEGYLTKADAFGREKFLKSGSGRKFLNKQLKNYLGS